MDPQVTALINEMRHHLDDVEWLSAAIVRLSAINYEVGKLMAEAKLNESQSIARLMDTSSALDTKKMAVSEAERRAIVETNNDYEACKNQHEDIVELVNSIKKRLDVLSWERKH